MADGALKAKAQEAMSKQVQAKKSVETYLATEKLYLEKLEKLADSDGNVTKDDYLSFVGEMADTASKHFKEQFAAMLAAVPSAQQQMVMLVSGFVDPPAILKAVMTEKPFIFDRTISAVFENFGSNGKLNLGSLRAMFNMFAGSVDDRVTTSDPTARLKAVFDLLDTDKDGTLSPNETARVLCGCIKVTFSAIGELILFYLRLLRLRSL